VRVVIERLTQSAKNPLGGIGAVTAAADDAVDIEPEDGVEDVESLVECRRRVISIISIILAIRLAAAA
jgi:hypothetical protein